MKIREANSYPIEKWLLHEGIAPQRQKRVYHWYKTPHKTDAAVLFKVDVYRNTWSDSHLHAGGSLTDLVCWLYSVSLPEALKILSGKLKPKHKNLFFDKNKAREFINPKMTYVRTVNHRIPLHYLRSRFIYDRQSLTDIKQAVVSIGTMKHRVLAFENDKGGYILKSECYTGIVYPKAVTTINPGRTSVNLFFDFIDYLSALSYYRKHEPQNTTIVLNHSLMLPIVIDELKGYETINLYFPNNRSGKIAATKITNSHTNVINHSARIFSEFETFNDFLISFRVNRKKAVRSRKSVTC